MSTPDVGYHGKSRSDLEVRANFVHPLFKQAIEKHLSLSEAAWFLISHCYSTIRPIFFLIYDTTMINLTDFISTNDV